MRTRSRTHLGIGSVRRGTEWDAQRRKAAQAERAHSGEESRARKRGKPEKEGLERVLTVT